MAGVSGQENVLAQRLNQLFATVHPDGKGPYTLREVADAINREAGETIISASYLSQLRAGQRREPSHTRLAAIARFFRVGVDYFSTEVSGEDAGRQLEVLTVLSDPAVRAIALRAHGLSESSLAVVLAVIENARRLENLPDLERPACAVSGARGV